MRTPGSLTVQELLVALLQKELGKGHIFYSKQYKGKSKVTCYLSIRPGEQRWTLIKEIATNGHTEYVYLPALTQYPLTGGELSMILPLNRYSKHSPECQDGERIVCDYHRQLGM